MTETATLDGPGKGPGPARRAMALAFILPILLAAPFANKALHIDDPMFVRVAQQIVESPLDYFGSYVDKGNVAVPMYEYNQNPPGFSYYLAIIGAIAGWGEVPMHIGAALFAGLAGLGMYLLASRFCSRPGLAAGMMVLTPAFLVSATTVMTDLPMVALYVWAVYLWMRALDEDSARFFVASVAVITIAALFKYYAITLVPLLLVYSIVKERRVGLWVAYLAIPVLLTGVFLWTAYVQYGVNLLSIASSVALDPVLREGGAPFSRGLIVLVFIGGCMAPLALYSPFAMSRRVWISCILGVAAASIPSIGGYSPLQLLLGVVEPFDIGLTLHLGVMLAAGLLIAIPVFLDLRYRPGAESILLALWVLGAVLFAEEINHLINARVVLPVLPAAAILIVRQMPAPKRDALADRRLREAVPLVPAAILTLWVAVADYAIAENARQSAHRAADIAEEEGVDLYYSGLWGFVYYLEERGAAAFSVEPGGLGGGHRPMMQTGELLALSSEGREQWRVPPKDMEEVSILSYPNRFSLATYHPVAEAGFYSHLTGIVPYYIGPTRPEEYGLYRWTGPSYAPDERESGGADSEPEPR